MAVVRNSFSGTLETALSNIKTITIIGLTSETSTTSVSNFSHPDRKLL